MLLCVCHHVVCFRLRVGRRWSGGGTVAACWLDNRPSANLRHTAAAPWRCRDSETCCVGGGPQVVDRVVPDVGIVSARRCSATALTEQPTCSAITSSGAVPSSASSLFDQGCPSGHRCIPRAWRSVVFSCAPGFRALTLIGMLAYDQGSCSWLQGRRGFGPSRGMIYRI